MFLFFAFCLFALFIVVVCCFFVVGFTDRLQKSAIDILWTLLAYGLIYASEICMVYHGYILVLFDLYRVFCLMQTAFE